MQTSTLQDKVGGTYNRVISGAVFLIASLNLIRGIFKNLDLSRILIFTIPIFVLALLLLLLKKSVILSVFILTVGIFSTIYNEDSGNYSGSILFALSFIVIDKKYYAFILSVITIIAISTNTYINHYDFNTSINLFIAYLIIYSLFYFIVYRKIKKLEKQIKELEEQLRKKNKQEPITRNIDIINIEEEEKAIIKLYCNGMTYENISSFLGLNVVPKTIRKTITKVKKEYNIKSDAHFAHWAFSKV